MEWKLILNIIAALFIYEILLKAIAKTLISYVINNDKDIEKVIKKKSFKERLHDKLAEDEMK